MAGGPIAVYGASGYTGRLVVAELARRGIETMLSGRNADKLHAVAGRLGLDARVCAASLDDRPALRRAIGDCAAVVNCAGPFARFGEPVVRAAIETGTHYVDTTGEQTFIRRIFEHHDDAARAAEVAVVPAMGFDYVPGDLIAHLAARGHEPLAELVIAYAVEGFGATRGTLRSALEMLKGGDVVYRDGDWQPAGTGPLRASFAFPAPVGRQPVAQYPSGEVITAPRHVDTRRVTSLITSAAFAPHPALARAVPASLPAVSLACRTPLRHLLGAVIDRLPEGPSEGQRRRSRFTLVALARGEDGRVGRGAVSGSDVYGLTAATAVHGASLLAAPGYDRAGALSPASAFDAVAFLDALAEHGLSYEAGSLEI